MDSARVSARNYDEALTKALIVRLLREVQTDFWESLV